MDAAQLDMVTRLLQLAEKFGLSLVIMFILFLGQLFIMNRLLTGKLVPRSFLDKSEADRDRMLTVLNELKDPLEKLTLAVNNIKRDPDPSDRE